MPSCTSVYQGHQKRTFSLQSIPSTRLYIVQVVTIQLTERGGRVAAHYKINFLYFEKNNKLISYILNKIINLFFIF